MRGRAGRLALAAIVIATAAGCGSFEDPDVVIDLRVLAMSATPPTQVIDITFDPSLPIVPAQVLDQLAPTKVCALVADPGLDRRLAWSISMCPLADDKRCATGTEIEVGHGVLEDPELALTNPKLCATVMPDAELFALLYGALQDDMLHGLGGLRYGVQLRIGGELADRALDQYAVKTVEVVPRFPADVMPNDNPRLRRIDLEINEAFSALLSLDVRCVNDAQPLQIPPRSRVKMNPIESDGTREDYVVPTLDGSSQRFTETLTYQWTASAGGFTAGTSGGPRDLLGNEPVLFTEYHAPSEDELDGPLDVSIWLVQRDERYGVAWYTGCLRVVPPPTPSGP